MEINLVFIVIYLVVVNVVTFCIYGYDKWLAQQHRWRVSETTLLLLAAIGGSVGALLGMQIWRHKTQHNLFVYGVPALLLLHVVAVGVVVALMAD